jgi:ABC-type Fe3+/spermidine/putrescine transport system ATPase subunit
MKKVKLLSLSLTLFTIFSCTGSRTNINNYDAADTNANIKSEVKKSEEMTNEAYYELKSGESILSFIGKKIVFEGKISEIPMQHMMRMSPTFQGQESEENEYIEPADKFKGGQIVAYYLPSKVKWPGKKDGLRFYGTMQKMSGAGKGGGEHTEYYLMLDKVE